MNGFEDLDKDFMTLAVPLALLCGYGILSHGILGDSHIGSVFVR